MTVETGTTPSAPPVLDVRQRNVVFATIVLGMLLAALDQTIVGTALPTIVADLGGAAHMSWVVTSYLLAETTPTGRYCRTSRTTRPALGSVQGGNVARTA